MHTRKKLVLSAALLGLSAASWAQKAPSAPQRLTSVEGITEYVLGNGMHVLLFPDPGKPTITVNITYKVGSRVEGYGETGMAHLLEHMVFKGSPKHKNIPAELTAHGASPNGTTSDDRTNYFETFAASDENLNWALDLESDRMVNSYIADKDLRSEFTVVRNEFERGENNPSGVLMERIMSTAFLWHNYGKSTIGSKEDIEKVPIENLQAFYHKYYQPDNAYLVVAGKIDEEKTLALVNKYFGVIPRPARVLQPDYTIEPTQDGERTVELRRAGDVQSIACAYHIPAGSHADYPALDVLNEVLVNEPNGRMYQSVQKSGKASVIWGFADGKKDAGYMYFNADVLKEKSLDDARKAMFATIDELHSKPVSAEEVDKAKTKLLNDYDEVYRNTGRIGLLLSEFIAQGDWRLLYIYRDRLKAVKADDVNRVATAYLKSSNRTWGTFVPTPNADRAIIPANPDVASIVKDYKGQAALASGEAFDPTPDNIDKRTVRGDLVGGAKYALLSKTTRGNTVEARITLRIGDEGSLKNKAAIADVTADMLMRGSSKHTQAQLNEALNKLSSKMTVNGTGQTVSINITSTKQNLMAVLDLADEILHQPAFQSDEFKTVIAQDISGIEEQRSEPTALAGQEFSRLLNTYPKGDIRYTPTPDEQKDMYNKVTLDDVKAFHRDYYNGSNATVAIVGDFDAPVIKERLNKMFYNWNATKSYTRIASPYQNTAAQSKDIKTPDKKNAMMVAGMNLKIRDDNPDYASLTMANFMFGGGFLNSRLATRIRQKEGISYGVGSQLNASPLDENGTFLSYAILNPENKAKLLTVWKEEMVKLVNDGFTEDELKAAKSGILQYRQTARANDAQLAGALNSNLFLGRTMEFSKKVDTQLENLTLAEVNSAVKKYFDPNKVTVVMAGDFK
jgi:zinc protease